MSVLQVSSLHKHFGHKKAVDDISFEVRRGEIVGLLGPNGAGKTTTINMILGVLAADSGSIQIEGADITRQRSLALSHADFVAVYAQLPGNLTVEQNLRVFGLIHDVRSLSARIEAVLDEFDLQALRHAKCGVLSSGEQTRACLAKAMLSRPRLLLLDEPTASLDPAAARETRAKLRQLAATGQHGILWTSHNMYEVAEVCDRVLFLARGKLLLEGDPRALPAQHGAATLEDLFIRLARQPLAPPAGEVA